MPSSALCEIHISYEYITILSSHLVSNEQLGDFIRCLILILKPRDHLSLVSLKKKGQLSYDRAL
jgi:hypothetical protein